MGPFFLPHSLTYLTERVREPMLTMLSRRR